MCFVMSLPAKTKFDPQFPINPAGPASQVFRDYLIKLDAVVAALAGGTLPALGNFANDAAASAGGVAIGNMYRNGSILMVRVV